MSRIKKSALGAALAVAVVLPANTVASSNGMAEVIETVKNKAVGSAESLAERESLKGLNKIFDKSEFSATFNDGSPEFELGVLKAYDENNENAFFFNQYGINRYDDRTTLNLGVGYRALNADQTWMGGVNVFYDHEFPNAHKRYGFGAELISSSFQLRANRYNGKTGFITDRSGTDSKALDGYDTRLKVALPYMPGAFFEYTSYVWEGVESAEDAKGVKYALGGHLSDTLSLNIIHTDHDSAAAKDTNRVELRYHWKFGNSSARPTLFNMTDSAYQLTKLTAQKFDLVERENRIVKQKKFSATASGF